MIVANGYLLATTNGCYLIDRNSVSELPETPSTYAVSSSGSTLPVTVGHENSVRRGLVLGLCSAVAYSAANMSLRGLSGRDESLPWAVWVTAMKAFPTVVLASFLLMLRFRRREKFYPTRKPIPPLIIAALVMQYGGNLGFQIALVHVGLAIAVPLVFALIICAGAILGRIFLGDSVSRRTIVAMIIMLVSVVALSYAATLNSAEETNSSAVVWFGVLMAVVSGLSYGINGAVIRGVARDLLPVESMLIIYSTTGAVSLSLIGYGLLGSERNSLITTEEWLMMLSAGTFNAIAFYCITNALKLVNISQVNVINASQNAMCAIAAVLIFAEPVSLPLVFWNPAFYRRVVCT